MNLAVVAPLAAYAVLLLSDRLSGRENHRGWLTLALAGWVSVVAAAGAVAAVVALFGGARTGAGWGLIRTHLLIGIVEGAVTAFGAACCGALSMNKRQ